jgi:hypothetical protein
VCFPEFALENHIFLGMGSKAHTNRQASQHDCLPSLLGDGDKKSEIEYGEGKKFVLGRLEQPRQNKNLLYWNDKRKEPTKTGSPFICPLRVS